MRGNHKQMLIHCISGHGDIPRHIRNGGAWLYELEPDIQQELSKTLQALPLVIEIKLSNDHTIGIVHAEAPVIQSNDDWQEAKDAITGKSGEQPSAASLEDSVVCQRKNLSTISYNH
ncbi:metallophosphoesterase family protein [Pseudomonas sp. H3_H05]